MNFTKPLIPLIPENVKYIVIHHAEADTASDTDIHAWHLQRGWSGAGYNEYIRKDGTVTIMRGDNVGAQCVGYNSVSYGICLEGNYQKNGDVPEAQWKALIERALYHAKRFNAKIVLHSDLTKTDCPGKAFPKLKLELSLKEDIMDTKNPLQTLIDAKIITNKEYWENAMNVVKFLDKLILNMAEYVKKKKEQA